MCTEALTPGQGLAAIPWAAWEWQEYQEWGIQGAINSGILMTDKHPDFPYTEVKEVARIIIKSLPMEESHDKTKQNKKTPIKSINQATKTKQKPPTKCQ